MIKIKQSDILKFTIILNLAKTRLEEFVQDDNEDNLSIEERLPNRKLLKYCNDLLISIKKSEKI